MTDIEIKEANRLFWIIKGHLIPDSWSDSEIASISESYFRRIWGNHEACYREEGCIRYDLFVDCDDPTKFTFIEEWSSREALAKHGQSAHITAGRTRFPELLAQPAWVQVATQIK